MHRVYWVLFTVLCACVVSVPSSHRFHTRKGHINRALSKLRTSKRNVVLGASRVNHPSASFKSKKNSPKGVFTAIYEDGSEKFMNPHYLQDKIETLTEADEHFIDYGDEENYDNDGVSESENDKTEEVYYEDGLDSDPEIVHVAGQSTESEQIWDEDDDEYDEEEDELNPDLDEVKILDQSIDSTQWLDNENSEIGEDEIDSHPKDIHVAGQSTDSDQSVDDYDDQYDEDDDGFDLDPKNIHVAGLSNESEESWDNDDDEYDEEEGGLGSDSIHVVGHSAVSEDVLEDDHDEYYEEGDLDSDSIHVVGQSAETEDLLEDDHDEHDEEGDDSNSDMNDIPIHLEDDQDRNEEGDDSDVDMNDMPIHLEDDNDEYDEEEDDSNFDMNGIPVHGQSTESEQANETEHNLYQADANEDEEADHELSDEDLKRDEDGLDESMDMMVQGQALLLGDSESDRAESSEISDEDEEGLVEDELYEPLDDVMVAHYETDDTDEESSDEDLAVDGMSYEDEPHSRKDYVVDEDGEILSDFGDDSEMLDTEDVAPVEHEYELTEDQQQAQKDAMEYNFDEDVEAFEDELDSLIRQDHVNGQSALQGSHPSSYSSSAVLRESDSEHGEENDFDEDGDYEDDDYELEGDVGVSRTAFFSNSEDHDHDSYGDSDVYLDDDNEIEEDEQDYVSNLNLRTSASEPTGSVHVGQRFMDDAEDDEPNFEMAPRSDGVPHEYSGTDQIGDEEVHVDGFAVVHDDVVDNDLPTSYKSTSDNGEQVFQDSRIDTEKHDIIHGEDDGEEVFVEDEADFEEDSRWASRQESDYSDEAEDFEENADDDWDEYLLDLASAHQQDRMQDKGEHELSDSLTNHMKDTEPTSHTHGEGGRFDLEEQLEINSHPHDMLRHSMKSIGV